jgi:hypothetical protein
MMSDGGIFGCFMVVQFILNCGFAKDRREVIMPFCGYWDYF